MLHIEWNTTMELNNVMHERVVELGILIFKNYGAN